MSNEVYNVNTIEYLKSDEFNNIAEYILETRHNRAYNLLDKYPGFLINPRCQDDNDMTDYLKRFNVPYYDMLCETIVHKDDTGYIDIVEFTYQLNCFAKTIFHRRYWAGELRDTFLDFVWNDWKKYQIDNCFDRLEQQANTMFEQLDLFEYHKQFVYNDQYQFATEDDMRKLFDHLVEVGLLLSKQDDLYEIYTGIDLEDANTNIKERFHNGAISKMDVLHTTANFNVKTLPKLQSIKGRFNLIPVDGSNEFNGMWLEHKLNNKIWFIPQFLAFYNVNQA
jgi:hypothetical protein